MAILSCILSLGFFSSSTLAVEAEGTIEEVRVCSLSVAHWRGVTYFKISDGTWFYILTHSSEGTDSDDNASLSVVMTAYASRFKVKVRATATSSATMSQDRCGVSNANVFWGVDGDYIALKEYVE